MLVERASKLLSNLKTLISYLRENHRKKFWFFLLVAFYYSAKRLFTKRKSIRDSVVVITGGASGVGSAVAMRCANLGAKVVLWDINERGLMQVSQKIAAAGGYVWIYMCDLTDKKAVDETAARVKREVGKVDILINNAGALSGKTLIDLTEADIQKNFQVNVISHFWTVKAFLPEMCERNRGHICSVASGAGHIGINKLTDYCASKFAVVGFDEALRMELKRKGLNGVHTTCVSPHYISTGLFEGVKTRISWLLPILDESYVADRMVEAILTNKHELRMPRLLYFISLLKFLLPTTFFDWTTNLMGFNTSMDDFRGRPIEKNKGSEPYLH